MKNIKRNFLSFALLALGATTLAGCGGNNPSTDPSTDPSADPSTDPWYVISEKAMDNFLTKIQAGGYTMVGDEQTTVVKDENMVTWFFPQNSQYDDHVALTVDEETYYAFIDYEKNSLEEMVFLDKKPATQIDEIMVYLPTYWLSDAMSGGNIWTLFHNNDQTNPLHFNAAASFDLYATICYFCNYDANELPSHMQDVYMEFDTVDVHQASIKFKYNPGGTAQLTDGLVTITFDDEIRTSDIAEAWLNNPNREYPTPIGEASNWPATYYTDIISVYSKNLGFKDGAEPLPFDNFFSYATKIDHNLAKYHGIIEIHDYHADEEDAKQYMNTLKDKGYQAEIGVTGMVFRSPVLRDREGYRLFSDITLTLDDGLIISAQRYYTTTNYAGKDAINTHIQEASTKYYNFQDSSNITKWSAIDSPFRAYESTGCMYDTNLYLQVYLEYKDADQMDAYLATYFKTYTDNGFIYNDHDGTYSKADQASRTVLKLESNGSGVANILFYNYRRILPNDAFQVVADAGFPVVTVDNDKVESILEINGYERLILGQVWTHYYWVTISYDTRDELMDFVNSYQTALVDDAGFTRVPEQMRSARFQNNDGTKVALLDYQGNTSTLNMWFAIK